ncbi:pkb-activating kinase-like protein [Cladochytrium tenue]|nr:pkb-activating kinase-like protein [Cladochytrium tenue]
MRLTDDDSGGAATTPAAAVPNDDARSHTVRPPSPAVSSATAGVAALTTTQQQQQQQKKIPQDFEFGRILGEGSYSTVILAKERSTGREFAVKMLDKRHIIKEKKTKYVQIEKDVLNRVSHPFIVRLFYTFQTQSSLYFVLECAHNGDLLTMLRRRLFGLEASRFYASEIIVGVEYLHSQNIIHRDLKPENVLIDSAFHIRLADFGSAKILENGRVEGGNPEGVTNASKRNSFVGTAEYCSPELLNDRAAGFQSDIWAIGCILFQLISGSPPFKAGNEYQTFQKIIKLDYAFPPSFPEDARAAVASILVLEPQSRPTIPQLKAAAFFSGVVWERMDLQTPPVPPLKPGQSDEPIEDFHSSVEGLELVGLRESTDRDLAYPYEVRSDPPPPMDEKFGRVISDPGAASASGSAPALPVDPQAEREKALLRQKTSPLISLVSPTELIVLAGSVYKKRVCLRRFFL